MKKNIRIIAGIILSCMGLSNAHYRSASVEFSSINYPYQGALVNTQVPVITGTLCDENGQTLNDESITIIIDGQPLGTTTSGQGHGIFVFAIPEDAPLAEGDHTVTVRIDDLDQTLQPVSFTVDVLPPAAPIIISPANNQVCSSPLISITGTSEPHVTIFLFLDGSDYADVIYADQNGKWSVEYELSAGGHSIYAHAESQAGNPGPASSTCLFTIA